MPPKVTNVTTISETVAKVKAVDHSWRRLHRAGPVSGVMVSCFAMSLPTPQSAATPSPRPAVNPGSHATAARVTVALRRARSAQTECGLHRGGNPRAVGGVADACAYRLHDLTQRPAGVLARSHRRGF